MKKDSVFFSIIIPVYNTPKKYFEKAFNSVMKQEESFELIIVNDGSKEKCSNYLEEYAKKDDRIVLINQENQGVSKARNQGILYSRGEYIVFMDADDQISNDMLKQAKEYLSHKKVDAIFGRIEYIPSKETNQVKDSAEIFEGKNLIEAKKSLLNIENRKYDFQILGSPCGRVYRAEIVKKCLFEEEVSYCEDQLFNRKVFNNSNSIMVVPNIWYYYYQNDFSATHKTIKANYYNMIKPFWDNLVRYNELESKELQEDLHIQSLGMFYSAIRSDYIASIRGINNKRKIISKIANHSLIQNAICYLKNNSRQMNFSQKVGLFLLKNKFYIIIFCLHYLKKNARK